MKADIKKSVEMQLTLTLDEAIWLKDLMQNPLFVSENEVTCKLREKFFTTLKQEIDNL
jgi:hypothetical protein